MAGAVCRGSCSAASPNPWLEPRHARSCSFAPGRFVRTHRRRSTRITGSAVSTAPCHRRAKRVRGSRERAQTLRACRLPWCHRPWNATCNSTAVHLPSSFQEMTMRVQDLMTHPAITCHGNDVLDRAAQRMWEHDCGALPVVNDEGKVTGMITDRDVCMAALTQGRPLHDLLVNVAMAKHVIAVGPDNTIGDVEHLMAEHQIRRLPVLDAANRPLGVISLNDLAIEAVQPDTRMKHGISKVTHPLAPVCQPDAAKQRAHDGA